MYVVFLPQSDKAPAYDASVSKMLASFVEYRINFRSYSQFVHDENLTKRGIFLLVYVILRIYGWNGCHL